MIDTAGRVLTHVVLTMGGILLEVLGWLLAIAVAWAVIYAVAAAVLVVFLKALSIWFDFVGGVLQALGVGQGDKK